jgi:hypothetical protein
MNRRQDGLVPRHRGLDGFPAVFAPPDGRDRPSGYLLEYAMARRSEAPSTWHVLRRFAATSRRDSSPGTHQILCGEVLEGLSYRAKCNSAAALGKYVSDMEQPSALA